jgi:hypothetical protein
MRALCHTLIPFQHSSPLADAVYPIWVKNLIGRFRVNQAIITFLPGTSVAWVKRANLTTIWN